MLVNDTYLDAKQEISFKKISRLLESFATAAEIVNPGPIEAAIACAVVSEMVTPSFMLWIQEHDRVMVDELVRSVILSKMRKAGCLAP